MLDRNKSSIIALSGGDADWLEREGAMLEILKDVTSPIKLDRDGPLKLKVKARAAAGAVTLCFPDPPPDRVSAIRSKLTQSLLIQFLQRDDFVRDLSVRANDLTLTISSGIEDATSPEQQIYSVITNPFAGLGIRERTTANRILHDLKNHLVGADIAASIPSLDRTARLKAELDVSTHLDAAKRMCDAFQNLTGASSDIRLERLSVRDFFRRYCAQALLEIPSRIAFRPASTVKDVMFWTSSDLLRSILDNLLRNAVDAIVGNGVIAVEWDASEGNDTLQLEITDSGRGMSEETLTKLLEGSSVISGKVAGSGVGMLTVTSMLRRLGGDITGHSDLGKGTRWQIQLPNLAPIEQEQSTQEREDIEIVAPQV